MLQIQSPIWNKKAVGIAIEGKADNHIIELEILATKKGGIRYYPNPFTITVAEIKDKKLYIEERKGNRPMLYIVPILALHESRQGQDKETSC